MLVHTQSPHDPDDEDEALWSYAVTVEKQWRASLPRFSDADLLAIFPEARTVIPEKLVEWKQERGRLVRLITQKLAIIQRTVAPENRWFWRAWVKYTDGPPLLEIEAQLAWLRRLHAAATGIRRQGTLNDAHIQQARTIPLTRLITTPLRPSGKTLVGRCPLHEDRRPSFAVYPATNSWYCYGCQRGGDTIAFIRYLHRLSFHEAVRSLLDGL